MPRRIGMPAGTLGDLELLGTIDFRDLTAFDLKASGATTVNTGGNVYNVTPINGGNAGNAEIVAESVADANDGYCRIDCTDNAADFWDTASSSPRIEIGDLEDLGFKPGDRMIVVVTCAQVPAFSANAANPSLNLYVRPNAAAESYDNQRYAHGAGGWDASNYPMPGAIARKAGTADQPLSPIILGFQLPWSAFQMNTAWSASGKKPNQLGWDETMVDEVFRFGIGIRKGNAGVSQASTEIRISTIEFYRDNRAAVDV